MLPTSLLPVETHLISGVAILLAVVKTQIVDQPEYDGSHRSTMFGEIY